MQGKRILKYVLGAIFSILFFIGAFYAYLWWDFLHNPIELPNNQAVQVFVKKGMTSHDVANELVKQGVMSHPKMFLALARYMNATEALKAGVYHIEPGITPSELIEKLRLGKAIMHPFTLVNSWRFSEIKHALDKNKYLDHDIKGLSNEEIMVKIGAPGQNPEGRFYPETYHFRYQTSDLLILRIAYQKMKKILAEEWANRAPNLPWKCEYDALIAASLIIEETEHEQEMDEIAGVMVRRINLGMPLQIDPTVIYALGDHYRYPLKLSDLKVRSSYNTYLHKGLPPTPIAVPTRAAIHAALHPAEGTAIFYMAKGDGSHVFTDNLKDHRKAKKRYEIRERSLHHKHHKKHDMRSEFYRYYY